MLDIKSIAENPEIVKDDLRKRNDLEKLPWIDDVVKKYKSYGKLVYEVQQLRAKRNKVSQQIAEMKGAGKDIGLLLREMKAIPGQIEKKEGEVERLKSKIDWYLMRLPNIMHKSVPRGADESQNVRIRQWGEKPKMKFEPLDHIDIVRNLDLADIDRAAKVAGARFYYLKNELVLLNQALIKFALDFISGKGYRLFQPPYMLRKQAIGGAVALSDFEDVIYKVEGEDLYLIGTSEHALLSYHMGEIIEGSKLPLRYAAISPCYRKEAGAHGRDTKGIFRVHQFEKVEQFIFCKPPDSRKMHEELIRNAEEFMRKLRIPYRVVNICTGDLGTVAAKKYDLDAWLPGQRQYREVVSCSDCTDYQSRRSGIRFRDSTSDPTQHPHTLNSTLVATERTLIAILENYQQADGSVKIPTALQPYMNGMKAIKRK
ncbi:MAG: serine--tRNA ligase [Candidatus Aenigmarchaeota archaeon]|nr:serine--tRNA ligase [Candidatus Aenigmarchaeota archaeon]